MPTVSHRHRGTPHPRWNLRIERLVVAVATMAVILAIAVLRLGWPTFGTG